MSPPKSYAYLLMPTVTALETGNYSIIEAMEASGEVIPDGTLILDFQSPEM